MICIEVKSIISAEGGASYGHEQQADRPAVIVSNEKNNENSGVVEVVYLTTQPKTDLPTHTVIRSTGRVSTVLCEQIVSVSVDRIAGYKYNETIKEQQEEIDHLKTEIEEMEKDRKELIEQVNQYAAANAEKNKKVEQSASQESMIRLETERDTFKQLYESLLTKVMAS